MRLLACQSRRHPGALSTLFFVRTVTFWPQAPPEEAPILCVAPHSTFFDALAVAVMGAPSVVAKAETKNVPFFGSLIRCVMPLQKQGYQ